MQSNIVGRLTATINLQPFEGFFKNTQAVNSGIIVKPLYLNIAEVPKIIAHKVLFFPDKIPCHPITIQANKGISGINEL